MKTFKLIPILGMLSIGVLFSCESENETFDTMDADNVADNTASTSNQNPNKVELGEAGKYAILSKSGVTNVPPSTITGDMGVSPIAQTAITGFALSLDSSGTFATSSQVSGKIYAASAAAPTPSELTLSVLDMQAAYTDAAGRTNPDFLNLGAGNISGLTLDPGLYKWTTGLLVPTDVTIKGDADDVWIFQVAGTFNMSSAARINLADGAKAENIFWQIAGAVTLGTTSHFEGILLGATSVAVQTGASVNGRLLAQTAVTLQMNTVTEPASTTVAIGDLIDGGVVFWVNPDDNTHGLVCAMSDSATEVEWGCFLTDLLNVPNVAYNNGNPMGPGAEIGYGESNTNLILDDCSGAPAATAAGSLGDGWFLPSINELQEMYVHKEILEAVSGFNAFSDDWGYWSSTEGSLFVAWVQYFYNDGIQTNANRSNNSFNVRAVRAF